MTYPEYGKAAKTHYKSCQALFDEYFKSSAVDNKVARDVLLRLYYLCGHIVECAAIYFIYKEFEWENNPDAKNWKGIDESIKGNKFNPRFTRDSHMHYDEIKVKEGKIICGNIHFGGIPKGEKQEFYNVKGHNFQKYIKGILWKKDYKIPYFRQDCPQDQPYEKAIYLLENWYPDLRYYYEGRMSGYWRKNLKKDNLPEISKESIENLLNLCKLIVGEIRSNNIQ